MKNTKVYVDFITEKLKKLLSIDSPTGYTKDAIAWLKAEYEAMGYAPVITTKGGLLVQLAKGCEGNGGVLVETHTDTLGGMVAEVKGNGRLRLTALGGMNPNNAETENCGRDTYLPGSPTCCGNRHRKEYGIHQSRTEGAAVSGSGAFLRKNRRGHGRGGDHGEVPCHQYAPENQFGE